MNKTRITRSSLPIALGSRNWSGFVLGAVCAMAGVATWSFVVGGAAAFYVDARMGAAAMIAGGLIGQFLVTLATVPASTKYGIETVVSTKPQLGVRGSYLGLFMLYATALGWNAVLMIFFGRAAASVLEIVGVIDASARTSTATIISALGLVGIWLLVSKGVSSLSKAGPIVTVAIIALSIWLIYLVVSTYGVTAIAEAQPLAPDPSRLVNYTTVVELLIASTFGWWGYMGGMMRMANSAGKAILPSMIGLGFAWVAVALVSLYSALMTGEADPTVWVREVAGSGGAVLVLLFIGVANLGSTLIGAYVGTLGVKQMGQWSARLSWRVTAAIVLAPVLLVLVFIPGPFFDNVGIFMAFIGMMIGPMVGIQIADWFVLGRSKSMIVSSLYRNDKSSAYWYWKGINVAGVLGLAAGSLTYLAILDPLTLIARSEIFGYTTASLPAVIVAGIVYVLASKVLVTSKQRAHMAEASTQVADDERVEADRGFAAQPSGVVSD